MWPWSRQDLARQTRRCNALVCRAGSAALERRAASPTRCSAYATRPPPGHGLTLCVENRGRQRLICSEPGQRVKPEPRGLDRRRRADSVRSSGSIFARAPAATCRRTMAAMASASARSPIAPSASAARPWTMGSGSSSAFMQRRTCGGVGQQAERERGHLAHFELFVRSAGASAVRLLQASPTRPAASAARRRTRASESPSRRMRSDGGGGATMCGSVSRGRPQDRRRRRVGIAQQALILEPQDPPELLFPTDNRECREAEAAVLARAGGGRRRTRGTQDDDDDECPRLEHCSGR